nr:efflux transporter outer membrane subunit [Ruficoccus amylovorans]
MFRMGVTLGAALALAGCQYTAQTPSADTTQPLPSTYGDTDEVSAAAKQEQWWTAFNRPDLNALEDQAMSGNLDLASAWARLRQAQAEAVIAGADLYPSVDASGSWSKTRTFGSGSATTDGWGLGTGIGYEVDLWGRIRAGSESAQAQAEASSFDVQATALTLSGDIASTWIGLLAYREGLRLLNDQVATNRTQLELILLRFANAQSNALAVLQQRQLLAAAEARLPEAERQIRLLQNQMALLLGVPADQVYDLDGNHELPALPPTPSTGIPSDLLTQRPDVRAAYLELESASWNVAGAKADRLPRISLSADATSTAQAFSDVFDSWSGSFVASLAQPLFDAGARQAEVERQLALARQAMLQYRSIVLTAYKEVRDALANEYWYTQALAALDVELVAAKQEFTEAQLRYINGQTDYLDVISSLSTLQGLQRERIDAVSQVLQSRIDLHLALGGNIPLENPQPGPILSPEDTIPFVPAIAEVFNGDSSDAQ